MLILSRVEVTREREGGGRHYYIRQALEKRKQIGCVCVSKCEII